MFSKVKNLVYLLQGKNLATVISILASAIGEVILSQVTSTPIKRPDATTRGFDKIWRWLFICVYIFFVQGIFRGLILMVKRLWPAPLLTSLGYTAAVSKPEDTYDLWGYRFNTPDAFYRFVDVLKEANPVKVVHPVLPVPSVPPGTWTFQSIMNLAFKTTASFLNETIHTAVQYPYLTAAIVIGCLGGGAWQAIQDKIITLPTTFWEYALGPITIPLGMIRGCGKIAYGASASAVGYIGQTTQDAAVKVAEVLSIQSQYQGLVGFVTRTYVDYLSPIVNWGLPYMSLLIVPYSIYSAWHFGFHPLQLLSWISSFHKTMTDGHVSVPNTSVAQPSVAPVSPAPGSSSPNLPNLFRSGAIGSPIVGNVSEIQNSPRPSEPMPQLPPSCIQNPVSSPSTRQPSNW